MSIFSRLLKRSTGVVDVLSPLRRSLKGVDMPKGRSLKKISSTGESIQSAGASSSRSLKKAPSSINTPHKEIQDSKPLANRFLRNTAAYSTGAGALGATGIGLYALGGRAISGSIEDVGSAVGVFRDNVFGEIPDNRTNEQIENQTKENQSKTDLQQAQNEGVQDTLTGAAVGGGGVLLLIGAGVGVYLLSQKGKKKSGKPKK